MRLVKLDGHRHSVMKCLYRLTGETHRSGRALLACERCRKPGLLPFDGKPESLDADCTGWPLPHEYREWWHLFKQTRFISEPARIIAFIRWRAAGSPIDQLPPGVPSLNVPPANAGLTAEEVKELMPDEDPTLIGNRIAALTKALGIPPCGACGKRRDWLNAAHKMLRGD